MFYIKMKFLDHYMICWWTDKYICDYSPFLFLFHLRKRQSMTQNWPRYHDCYTIDNFQTFNMQLCNLHQNNYYIVQNFKIITFQVFESFKNYYIVQTFKIATFQVFECFKQWLKDFGSFEHWPEIWWDINNVKVFKCCHSFSWLMVSSIFIT